MSLRRFTLVSGVVGLVVSAGRVRAGESVDPVDVEAGGYGGVASGGWACGPRADARYGGASAGARVRVAGPADRPREGLRVGAAGALEYRAYHALSCEEPCDDPQIVPAQGVLGAAKGEVAWDGRWVGVRGGPLLWQDHPDFRSRAPSSHLFPEVAVRIGKLEGLRGDIGLGSYSGSTMVRPGGYVGLAYGASTGWDVSAHLGAHDEFGYLHTRADAQLLVPLSNALQLGGGFALTEGTASRVDPEGRLLVVGHFGSE